MARTNGQVSRRNLLKVGGAFAAGAVGTTLAKSATAQGTLIAESTSTQSPTQSPKSELTPDQALQLLLDGNQRFVSRKRTNPHQDFAWISKIAKGQKPFAAILGCADSRFPAEILFDQGFGDLFVCRVAGNIAIPEQIGSLEFSSAVLGSKVILVMGHERCGAIEAAIKGAPVPGQIGTLIDAIKPAVASIKGQSAESLESAVKANVLYQIEKLKASPVLAQRIQEGKLKIAGGYYDLDTGKVTTIA